MPERPGIGGSTRLYAVLGCPVAQVKAPALLNPVFSRLGLEDGRLGRKAGRGFFRYDGTAS
nr:aminoquinate/shkimate dehydrogenase [Streptomyces sp. SS]